MCWCFFPWDIFILLVTTTDLILVDKLPSLNSSLCIFIISAAAGSASHSQLVSAITVYIKVKIHFQWFFVSLLHFHLSWWIPFQLFGFVKCLLGHKEATQPCALLSRHELNSRCTMTNKVTDFEKSDVISQDVNLLFT